MATQTILFVDDELELLADHVRQLEEAGYVVTQRRTTDEAIDEFVSDRGLNYSLVILDMMIPPPDRDDHQHYYDDWDGMRSGGRLLAILRERRPEPWPPVLLLSNLKDDEMLTEAWDRYTMWCDAHNLEMPPVRSHDAMAAALRDHFGTHVREKRRTPPWHLPKVAEEILAGQR